ncbi:MAG: sulfatase-like hydrolase/transferase [Verrucomicrobiales bacterium]|nr:sulfatase-like hydrolase/transferase [Verrucomicrobiales bacterium]
MPSVLVRTWISLFLGLGILGIGRTREVQAASSRPNFLIILTDDHGYGDVSTYGESDVRTPNLDRLAHEGMLFTHMRANATVCSPSRAALLTGCYPDRVGVPGVIRSDPTDSWGWFAPQSATLAHHLRVAGYRTAMVGKWHLGLNSPNLPNEHGFHHFQGFLGDMMDNYTNHLRHGVNYMRLNGNPIRPVGHATDLFTQWTIDYLKSQAKSRKPFFLYVAYNAPHFPMEPPAEWLERVKNRSPELTEARARNVALIEHLDDGIGRVLETLRQSGLAHNTLVAFSADNGGSKAHAQSNAPWRGGKQDHYEGGLRVPFIIRWPGTATAGSRSAYAGLVFDLFPTLMEAANLRMPPGLDAVSLLPLIKGWPPPATERDLYFVRREGGSTYGGKTYEALIRGDWKLLQNSPSLPMELYNLREDPFERHDLIKTQRAKAAELGTALRSHIQRGGRTPWQPPLQR